MTELPHLLLDHHLKTLKLPTFLREYDKVARPGAGGGRGHPRRRVRAAAVAVAGRERRTAERPARGDRFPAVKARGTFGFAVISALKKTLVVQLSPCG